MNYLLALVLGLSLTACGVRDEDPEPGSVQAATQSTSSPTSEGLGTSSPSNPDTGSESGEPANGETLENGQIVQLQFVDDFSGFWEADGQSDTEQTAILRIAFGQERYHLQRFFDQSSGRDALLENCYIREPGGVQRERSARGLWFIFERTDSEGNLDVTEDGWSLVNGVLTYSRFENDVENEAVARTYTRVFPGLAVDGLQLCEVAP